LLTIGEYNRHSDHSFCQAPKLNASIEPRTGKVDKRSSVTNSMDAGTGWTGGLRMGTCRIRAAGAGR
jgi:hypothetical protein